MTENNNSPAGIRRAVSLLLRIWLFLAGSAEQIVNTGAIKIGQSMQCRNGNIQISQFVVRISGLMDLQKLGYGLLRQIPILTQITQTVIFHGLKRCCHQGCVP